MTPDALRDLLRNAFPEAAVAVRDLTGTGDHFAVEVVSQRFVGLSTLERHRLVHDAVGDRLTREIHALSIRTAVPPSLA
jgi:stress-induced morphogen